MLRLQGRVQSFPRAVAVAPGTYAAERVLGLRASFSSLLRVECNAALAALPLALNAVTRIMKRRNTAFAE